MKDTKRLDYLFSLASQFREMEFWNKLRCSDLYAFEYNGTIYYCSLMGMTEKVYRLAVYIGEEGLKSYRRIYSDPGEPITQDRLYEWFKLQYSVNVEYYRGSEMYEPAEKKLKEYAQRNHMALSGSNLYSQFVFYEPQYGLRLANEKQREILIQALELSLYMANEWKKGRFFELGFSDADSGSIPLYCRGDNGKWDWHAYSLPQPKKDRLYSGGTVDEEIIRTILVLPKKKVTWVTHLFMSGYPIATETDDAFTSVDPGDPYALPEKNSFFPYIFAISIDGNRPMERIEYIERPDRDMYKAVEKMADLMLLRKQRPYRVVVYNKRDRAIVKKFCEDCGIKVEVNPDDADFEGIIKIKEEYVDKPVQFIMDTHLDESEQEKKAAELGFEMLINELRYQPEFLDSFDEEGFQTLRRNLAVLPEDVRKTVLRRMRKG